MEVGGVGLEVDADGREVGGGELGVAESDEDGAFSHGLRAHDDDLEGFGFEILA